MFEELSIETVGSCNRTCPTCERNSYPNRAAVAGRFGKQQRMPEELFRKIVDDAVAMGYRGPVNLQHYNEPFQDPRIGRLARYVKEKGVFSEVYMHTNGDLITPRKAREVDGVLDKMIVALYDGPGGQPLLGEARDQRRAAILAMFEKTTIEWAEGLHIVTHYSPYTNLEEVIAQMRPLPCRRESGLRMIIDYRGEFLLCCDDIVGLWKLGNAAESTLEELWFSEKHRLILETLSRPGGRESFGFCRICPRPDIFWPGDPMARPLPVV